MAQGASIRLTTWRLSVTTVLSDMDAEIAGVKYRIDKTRRFRCSGYRRPGYYPENHPDYPENHPDYP